MAVMSNKYGPSSSISRQQVFWIAGGIAVGLGGFALYYQRKKNLSAGRPRPPRSQVQMRSDSPPSPKPGNGSNPGSNPSLPPRAGNGSHGTSTSSGPPPDPNSGPPPQAPDSNGAQSSDSGKGGNGGRGTNGQHSQSHADSPSSEAEATGGVAGGAFPYGWAQNNDEAYLVTTCPLDLVSKDVSCKIQPRSMQLLVRGDLIVDGALFGPVDTSESIWELEDLDGKKKLTVTLVKASHCSGQAEWPTLLTNAHMPALNTIMA